MQRLPRDLVQLILTIVEVQPTWHTGVFKLVEPAHLYITLQWLMLKDSHLDLLFRLIQGGHLAEITLHLCHDTKYVTRAYAGPTVAITVRKSRSTIEQVVIDAIQARSAKEDNVAFIVEDCCPQMANFMHYEGRLDTFCNGSVLADNSFCPCCSGDCVYHPKHRTHALPGKFGDHFRQ